MKLFIAFFYLTGTAIIALADTNIVWQHTYFSGENGTATAILPTAHDGCIIAGNMSTMNQYIFIAGLDMNGDTLFKWRYGKVNDLVQSIDTTSDGGYVLAGSTRNNVAGESDVLIIKVDSTGTIVWEKRFGGKATDFAEAIKTLPNDEFIVAGMTSSFGAQRADGWLLKLNSKGDTIWTKRYHKYDLDMLYSVEPVGNQGFIAVGRVGKGYGVLRIATNGDTLWTRDYGISSYAADICTRSDGNFIITGEKQKSSNDPASIWTLALNESGDTISSATHSSDTGWDAGYSTISLRSGGFVVGGTVGGFAPGGYAICILFNSTGNAIWNMQFGKIGNGPNIIYDMAEIDDTSFVVTGVLSEQISSYSHKPKVWVAKIAYNNKPSAVHHKIPLKKVTIQTYDSNMPLRMYDLKGRTLHNVNRSIVSNHKQFANTGVYVIGKKGIRQSGVMLK
jgi:hypothetical protein